jgi:hypothetical protein
MEERIYLELQDLFVLIRSTSYNYIKELDEESVENALLKLNDKKFL